MHALEIPSLAAFNVPDWWALTPADLERVATILLGPLPGGWVRRGDNSIRVGNVKYGADARKLEAEFAALSVATKRILADGGPESAFRAAAFFHLRFENIHPMCEANGRIGRVILASQLQQSRVAPVADVLAGLKDLEADYSRLFATNNPPLMFELMIDLLSRITGIMLPPGSIGLPASIEPIHPQKKTPKNIPRLHPEKGMADPAAVREFAKQHQKRPGGNAFRKFF